VKTVALVSLVALAWASAFLLAILAYIGLAGRRNHYR
jgi:hypothetical protein